MDYKENDDKKNEYHKLKKELVKLKLNETRKIMAKLSKIPLNMQEVSNDGKRRN